MTAEENRNLSVETAAALLAAIKEAAPLARKRDTQELESLAKAYSAVVEAMPKPRGKPARIQSL